MQCSRCFSDLSANSPRCPVCGNKVGEGSAVKPGNSGARTGPLKKPGTASLPPEKNVSTGRLAPVPEESAGGLLGDRLKDLPIPETIKKARVGPRLGLGIVVVLLAGVGYYYAQVTYRFCLTCPKIQGKYEGVSTIGKETANVSVELVQEGSDVFGSVSVELPGNGRVTRKVAIPVRIKEFDSKKIKLETLGSSGNTCAFDGEVVGDGIKGKISLTIQDPALQGNQAEFYGKRQY